MKVWVDAARVFGLSWAVVILLLIPTGVGVFIDRRLGLYPWATLALALGAMFVATLAVTQYVRQRYDALAPPAPPPVTHSDFKEEDPSCLE